MTDIPLLHAAWCRHANQDLNLMATERIFYELAKAGFTEADIGIVVNGMKRHNQRSDAKYKIHCHKVCGDLEFFASLLADFSAQNRNRPKPPTPKEQVQQQFSPVVGEATSTGTALTVGEILSRVKS